MAAGAEGLSNLFEIRRPTPRLLAWGLGAAYILLVLFAWWFVTRGAAEERIVSPVILPSPGEVLQSIPMLVKDTPRFPGGIQRHLGISLVRVIKSCIIATIIVVPLGILMGAYGPIRAFFEPLNIIAGYLPLIIIVPLSFVWFAPLGGDWQKVLFLAIACFVYMLPLIVKAVDEVDEMFLNTGMTLGARGPQLLLKVLFPIALPDIYTAIRLSFGVAWTWILVGEGLAADPETGGLGYVFNAAYRNDKVLMYIPAFIILVVGFLADRILAWVGKFLFPYRYL